MKKSFVFFLTNKRGFTLAEVLIALTVIGVVMAITIPSVLRNHKAVSLKAGYETAFEITSRAVKKMNFEEGKLPTPDSYPSQKFKPAYVKYVKVLKDCGFGWADKDNSVKPCVERTLKENAANIFDTDTKNYRTYNKKNYIYSYRMDDGQIILLNGMYVFIENDNEPIFITVDVNGYVKRPNLWGHDLFTFQLMSDGKVLPMGAPGTMYTNMNAYCSKTSSDTMNGIACAYKAAMDPNYFKSLP
jgi:prepilin-type N-terminal cleavage/methylation domain-containing protein